MNGTRMVLLVLLLTFAFNLKADTPKDVINKRFILERNTDGKLLSIKMRFLASFSLRPYISKVKNDILAEVDRMRSKQYQAEIDEFIDFLAKDSAQKSEIDENSRVVRDALNNLRNIDIDHSFSEILKHDVLSTFEKDLRDALNFLDLRFLVNPNDSRFFYRKNVTYEVLTRALNFARNRFDSIPILNLASFILVKVHDLVLEQRLFNQNYLIYFLENFDSTELGLTDEEVDLIYSSIYESRISALNIIESNRATENWHNYGINIFYTKLRTANTRMRRATMSYEQVNKRYNFAFVEVMEQGQRVVKNLVDNTHTFSSKSPTAYNYDQPNRVKRTRSLLNLGQVGLGFIPIPGWLKAQAQRFLESFYVEQKITEGSLAAYFEMNENFEMLENILSQNHNPYLKF